MKLIKIFVDDTSYDTNDGYTLYSHSPYETSIIVKMAIENGFKDIRISEANADEIVFYNKNLQEGEPLEWNL